MSTGASCKKRRGWYLARVRVDDAHVLLALHPLQHDLLHVDADLLHVGASDLEVDQLQKFLDIPQELL